MKNIFLALLTLLSINLSAQEYFQQEVNYIIDVELDDENHTINGTEHIDYTNNSPDDLEFLWFHIWPNAYSSVESALSKQAIEGGSTTPYYVTEEEKGNISGLDFKVNGERVKWGYHPEHIDICKLLLNKPLKAGQTIRISTKFFVKIPDAKFSRLGHVDQSYMITQWYPKPAVYDVDGWHEMPYLSQGEFYSEFGSFDVSITLPSNYTVGATGDLQNKGEIARLNELAKVTDTITQFSDDMSIPLSDLSTKTLRYIQHNVHDFGWFADKRFHVLKGEVEVPHSKEKVTLWTMFTNNEADLWKNSIEYMHDAVYYYSLWNGDYPYKHCTAVDGTIAAGGGMEYPNVTVIGTSGSAIALEEVIMHEVGHNWFYGILASNERTHPWMDEGMNSFDELRYMRLKYPEHNLLTNEIPPFFTKLFDLKDYTNKNIQGELMYFMNAWSGKDQPIELHSAEYTGMNYGGIVYSKTAVVFDYLMAYLGEDMMNKCKRTYFDRWKFKHPQPKDLRAVFEEVSGKDLSWFFDDMIKTTKQLDYAIVGMKKETKDLLITLENKGEINGPVIISGVKDGEVKQKLWIDGFSNKQTIAFPNGNYDHIRIDYNGDMPETNRNNNIMRTKGILRCMEPIKPQIIGSLYHPEKTQIFFIPMVNWNVYSRSSYGINMYNQLIPKGGISYKLMPLYNNATKSVIGNWDLSYNKYSHNSMFKHLKLDISGRKNLYERDKEYKRIEPKLALTFMPSSLRSKVSNQLNASYIYLNKSEEQLGFINTEFKHSNKRTINPYSATVQIEKGGDFTKFNLTAKYNYHINQTKKLDIRGYFGFVNTENSIYNLQMSAWNGANDYAFSEKAFVRDNSHNNNLPYQQQLFINEGGLKHFTNLTSDSWLSTFSMEYNLTNRFKMYAEMGSNGKDFAYGSGFRIPMARNMLNIYLPIYTENGLVPLDDSYLGFFRFSLNIKLDLGSLF